MREASEEVVCEMGCDDGGGGGGSGCGVVVVGGVPGG